MAEKDGVKTALDIVVKDAGMTELQGELFDAEQALAAENCFVSVKRGPGRPKGSLNKRTLAHIDALTAKYGISPAEALFSLMSMDLDELCDTVGAVKVADRLECVKLKKAAAEALMPYVHTKMSPDITLNQGDVNVQIVRFGDDDSKTIETADFRQKSEDEKGNV